MARTRPIILTTLAAILAFIPLTHFGGLGLDGAHADRHGGGTVLILLFLRALVRVFG
ncbi:Uncharacterised protein [Starkeya nomas]|uniref:Uncharacterized protein n=1 Tax=Starkeya nomas TaxID=2666134 RepID=A0A5S9Q4N4_9HYPH|nr:Uncharacterised protein [Starkeya nomas]